MKPPPFEYHDPRTVAEALELLNHYGPDARILAGGQSLMPSLNFRLANPAALIDINRIDELSYIKEEYGQLRMGAITRQRQIEFSSLVRRRLPLLAEATQFVGHLPTRTRGTIGGSLAHADPAAEYPAIFAALDGELVIRGDAGTRVLHPADFFQGILTTAIKPGEMLIETRLPLTPAGSGWAFEEFSRRHGDFAIVAVVALVLPDDGRCRMARLAASAVGPIPLRLRAAEEILEHYGISERAIDDAAVQAAELVAPSSDLHASAEYRRHLTQVLTRRALTRAVARAKAATK